MGLWKRFAAKTADLMFTEGNEQEVVPQIPAEQLDGCEVEGDTEQTAKNMFDKALEEIDKYGTENTIYKVQECMDMWGGDCDATTVLKLIQIAQKNPEVLKKDGTDRIEKIKGVMKLVDNGMQQTLEATDARATELAESMSKEEAEYTADVDTLNKACEEAIKNLRIKLQQDIAARAQERDAHLEALKNEQNENATTRAAAEALNKEVTGIGNARITQIENLLSKLQA